MLIVSVILTTYNSEKTLQRTLNSIFSQKGINQDFTIELLVIDDCSTDKTIDILRQNNVLFLSTDKNSGGPNKGRNIGLGKCTGDFISFIDHDDEWLPDKLHFQLKYVEKVKIVTCGYITIDSTTEKERNNFDVSESKFRYFKKNETFLKKISKNNQAQRHYFGSILISKELKNTYFEEKYGMIDFDWLANIFKDNDSIEVNAPLFIRYVDGPNLSLNEKYRINDFNHSVECVMQYQKLHPAEVKNGIKKMHGSLARYYYLTGKMELARALFLKADKNFTTLFYYLTTFYGSNFVKRKFNIFG